MEVISLIITILKNFKYIAQVASLIDNAIQRGISEAELQKSIELLDKGFERAISKEDTANAARNINDSFRM